MKILLGLVSFIFVFTSFSSKADILIEPLVGFSTGIKGEIKPDASTGLQKNTFSGGGGGSFGGRLGYQKLGFQLGLDYLHSSLDMSDKDFKKNLSMNEWAGFVGFEFPILLRVYAGYIFSADGESKYDNGTTIDKMTLKSGSGAKAGIGFTVLPFLDINFEYRNGTFSEWKAGSTKFKSDIDYNVYMIGVSLPFTI